CKTCPFEQAFCAPCGQFTLSSPRCSLIAPRGTANVTNKLARSPPCSDPVTLVGADNGRHHALLLTSLFNRCQFGRSEKAAAIQGSRNQRIERSRGSYAYFPQRYQFLSCIRWDRRT